MNILSSTQIAIPHPPQCGKRPASPIHDPRHQNPASGAALVLADGGLGHLSSLCYQHWARPASCVDSSPREESQTASSPRHEMEMHVCLGAATKDGIVKEGIDLLHPVLQHRCLW